MKKSTIALAVAGVLLLLALLFPYTTSDGFSHKGLPFGYYKAIDTHGLCLGVIGETTSNGACGKRSFPLNYTYLAIDLAIVGLLSIALVYVTDRKNT